jgi:hypothetical protein
MSDPLSVAGKTVVSPGKQLARGDRPKVRENQRAGSVTDLKMFQEKDDCSSRFGQVSENK